MFRTTVGQLLINEALPNDLQDYTRRLDKKGVQALLEEVERRYPDQYRDILQRLMEVGADAAYTTGGMSTALEDLSPTPAVLASRMRLNQKIQEILDSPDTPEAKERRIIEAASGEHTRLSQEVLDEAQQAGNPLASQVISGSRGNALQLKRLIGGDLLYMDHRENIIPFPVQHSFAEGLEPAEYWASTYGARRGLVGTKLGTGKVGYVSKQLNNAAHRLLVTALDAAEPDLTFPRGLPVDVSDRDSVGALLAVPVGGYPRNTVLTPKILADLKSQEINRLLVRSPISGGPPEGGVYARDAGIRERGALPTLGELIGLAASSSLSEPITQLTIGSKHAGGLKGYGPQISFEYLNQILQVPKVYREGAAHAQLDGVVSRIEKAPVGGHHIVIGDKRHFVAPDFEIRVKPGDRVEAGDVLSDGVPNPAEIVHHKGIGEGRRYFLELFTDAYRQAGLPVQRRNVELLARGLIDHLEITDPTGDYLPGDVVPYSQLEGSWKPREGSRTTSAHEAVGRYLEKPVLHYSIGTRIRPSMLKDFDEFGVRSLVTHQDPPPFEARMIPAAFQITKDPDWMTRFLGGYQATSMLGGTHRGDVSDQTGTSYVPSLARGVGFGTRWPASAVGRTEV